MPVFDQNPLEKLAFQPGTADGELDLRGLDHGVALQRLEVFLRSTRQPQRWVVRFDPAGDDGRETLFLPVGRRLLAARRKGLLTSCLPLSDGDGYFVAFDREAPPDPAG